jgi:hypothetical protein
MRYRHRDARNLAAGLLRGIALLLTGCNTKAERGWNIPSTDVGGLLYGGAGGGCGGLYGGPNDLEWKEAA